MRITQIMLGKGLGGAERSFVDLCGALVDAGHEVQAVCHRWFRARDALARWAGLEVSPVFAVSQWDPLALYAVRRQISRFAPQVIHAHLARAAVTAGKVAPRLGLPLVAKTHNYVNLKYYQHVDLFIPTTRSQARHLRDSGIDPGRIVRIPNFSSFPPVDTVAVPHAGPIEFLSYARMVPKKGIEDLLRAFRIVLDAGVDARLSIGGDGPERDRLATLVRRLGLGDCVHLAGWINDVRAFLAAGDVFVLPSRLEPFGIALLEAMATGRPIVSTLSEGPSEILDERTAYLAAIDDPASLAQAMLEAAHDAPGRTSRAHAALALYRDEYHRDAVLPRIVEAYAGLIQGS